MSKKFEKLNNNFGIKKNKKYFEKFTSKTLDLKVSQ